MGRDGEKIQNLEIFSFCSDLSFGELKVQEYARDYPQRFRVRPLGFWSVGHESPAPSRPLGEKDSKLTR